MLAERECRLVLLLESIDSQRLQPPRLAAEPRPLGQPLQRRAAPEAECQRNGLRRAARIALTQRNARLAQQFLEPQRVDRRVVHQRVSVIGGDDRLLPERGPQTGDVVLESVPRCGRQLISP
jgi:hypothetical protein